MGKQATIAEMRFLAKGITLYGTVIRMSAEDVTMRLHNLVPSGLLVCANKVVELVVVAQNTLYMATTEVVAAEDTLLTLGFTTPVRTVQRRREERIPMQIEVGYRSVHDNGCFGVWKQGVSRDISVNGMCLTTPAGQDAAPRLEVLFQLPGQQAKLNVPEVLALDDPSEVLKAFADRKQAMARMPADDRQVKLIARLCHRNLSTPGLAILGLEFTSVSQRDQVRLARFINLAMLGHS